MSRLSLLTIDCVRLSQSIGRVKGPRYYGAAFRYNSTTLTQLFTVSLLDILGPFPTLITSYASKMKVLFPSSSMMTSSGRVQETEMHSWSPLSIRAPYVLIDQGQPRLM